jgi:adenylosuccinate lyase
MSDRKGYSESYSNPLVERYCSAEMSRIFSSRFKFGTWRRLWLALAEAQHELGLSVTADQVEQLRRTLDDLDPETAAQLEKELRHDVMAQLKTWAGQCPEAGGILHLGATSAYVGDNTEAIQLHEGLKLVEKRLLPVIAALREFAADTARIPTLGFTHFQPAQPTTVGKRACLWLQDLLSDLEEVRFALSTVKIRGVKGTTGTQASFLALFDGDHDKVEQLESLVAQKMGFDADGCFAVTGQTYPRKQDSRVLGALSALAQSASKFSHDMRLLQHLGEVLEPFGSKQVGSSAMAYKRNPMRAERISSLSRLVIGTAFNPQVTAATQWLERTLDDSANRRVSIPEAFLGMDAILLLYGSVVPGLQVNEKVIRRRLERELPFLATEQILMQLVAAGGDRQAGHEQIRVHSMEVHRRLQAGESNRNDLLERLASDTVFSPLRHKFPTLSDPLQFVGRAPEQVDQFLARHVDPILATASTEDLSGAGDDEIRV